MKSFVKSQFSYYPLIWIFHSRNMENKIRRLYERALRLVYDNNQKSSFEDLLVKDRNVSINQKILQKLAIENFKAKQGISPEIT